LLEDLPVKPEYIGHVLHQASIEHLMKARILLLVIPKVTNNRGILTGKFFEYLASGKPILAIGPCDGDLAAIIKSTGCGSIYDYGDWEGISRFIALHTASSRHAMPSEKAMAYSRRNLTNQLSTLLKK
jgi:hypothetical protein